MSDRHGQYIPPLIIVDELKKNYSASLDNREKAIK
jgi:hypothetical protein